MSAFLGSPSKVGDTLVRFTGGATGAVVLMALNGFATGAALDFFMLLKGFSVALGAVLFIGVGIGSSVKEVPLYDRYKSLISSLG
jgi:hypothetical protein